ncbi:SIN3-HDAC complex-associated factor [Caerostris extrusa]|uniref:SIN3-HDAC complex-associated factor n=1 Tax=Caerostris extrusa TaxID=172846 RepID=A0AAV4QCD4_CAEEX|nr:SIN3-HDAC complex-associated factor [Caerostris extrusa]
MKLSGLNLKSSAIAGDGQGWREREEGSGGSVIPGRGNLSLWLEGSSTGKIMFSFHRPKIYRSTNGCCICRAKSSSSRFTDSTRYESEFERCFRMSEKRSGEICNACVLLVKRWKKLPIGTNRDWHHVVDARAGPGTKCITKNKIKNDRTPAKKLRLRLCKSKRTANEALSDDVAGNEDSLSESLKLVSASGSSSKSLSK